METITSPRTHLGRARDPGSPLWAILMIVGGVVAIALPLIAGFGVLGLVSILFLVNGAAHVVHSFTARRLRSFAWHALIGVVYIGAGAYMLMNPDFGLSALAMLMGILFLVESALLVIAYTVTRRLRGAGWLLANSVLTGALGVLILATWPVNSGEIVGLLLGVNLIFSGFSRLMHRPVLT